MEPLQNLITGQRCLPHYLGSIIIDSGTGMLKNDCALPTQFAKDTATMLTRSRYICAYCGSVNEVEVDPSAGLYQEYEEDCQMCCCPNVLRVSLWSDGSGADIEAFRDDED
jgi:hypothetical protein